MKNLLLLCVAFASLPSAALLDQSTYDQDVANQRVAQQRNTEEAVRSQQKGSYSGGQTRTGNP